MSRIGKLLGGDREDPRKELVELFGGSIPRSGDAPAAALDWARSRVDVADASELEAIASLRRAEPRLGLKSATYLAARMYATR